MNEALDELEVVPREKIGIGRLCLSCNVNRLWSEYRTGRAACKKCEAAGSKARRLMAIATNPKAYWWRRSVQAARHRSKAKGFTDFGLEEAYPLAMPTHCPVLGSRLNYGDLPEWQGLSPSLDQVIPFRGYVYGNVRVISARANTMKSFGTLQEHLLVVMYMAKHLEEF